MLIDLCLEACEPESLGGAETAVLGELAARLNVESYVLDSLGPRQQRLGPGPASWLQDLRQRVFAVAVDNLRRDGELREVLARLDEEGIPLVLLKGSALRVERPGLAGRFQCDVDVLLRRTDLERAEAVLAGLGFQLDESYLDRERLLTDHFHLGYHRRGATVELHWDIDASSPEGFVGRLWDASRPAEVDGCAVRVPSPEHQLLVACLHLSRHAFWGGLRWLADLRFLLPLPAEARERFAAEARVWPRRAVYCPLWLLAGRGVPGSEPFAHGLGGPAERRFLEPLLTSLLLAEPWHGLPAWRGAKTLQAWLFSERSLLPLLSRAWGEGVLQRLHSRNGNGNGAPAP